MGISIKFLFATIRRLNSANIGTWKDLKLLYVESCCKDLLK